jgi:hypothetical protein
MGGEGVLCRFFLSCGQIEAFVRKGIVQAEKWSVERIILVA